MGVLEWGRAPISVLDPTLGIAASRAALLDYAREGGGLADGEAADAKLRGLAYLVLASPLYQLN